VLYSFEQRLVRLERLYLAIVIWVLYSDIFDCKSFACSLAWEILEDTLLSSLSSWVS
jgi:hypothetical protein